MQERKQIYEKAFLAVSSLATLFVLTEIVMQSYGKSICYTEGCKVVSQQVRFGDMSMLLTGLAVFVLLAFFSTQGLYRGRSEFERYSNVLLAASLAAEGYFVGYQVFSIHSACLFCLIIFGLIVILAMLRLLAGAQEMAAGFAALVVVFAMLYLVPPVGMTVNLPKDKLILFYSKDCKHCAEIIKELDEKKIAVTHLQAMEYADFLKSMAIESVPTLYVNDPKQKSFLIGTDAIRRYLLACTSPITAVEMPRQKARPGKRDSLLNMPEAGIPFDILSGSGATTTNDGMCKENEICK